MALLNILQYPDSRLYKVAKPVVVMDDRTHKFVVDMAETMYEAPGVGLTATQVDVHGRVTTIDMSESRDELHMFVNPEILQASDEHKVWDEGCLSVPDIYDKVDHPACVRVRILNEKGETSELEANDPLAVCIQYEMDHLMDKVFIEYFLPLKQTRIRSKLKKHQCDAVPQC